MSKGDLNPDLLVKQIKKSNPAMSSEQARRISEESCRRVDRERQDDKKKGN